MGRVLTGKWKWNDVINPMDAGDRHMQHDLWVKSGFTSNGQKFDSIRFTCDEAWKLKYGTGSSFVTTGVGYSEDDYATPYEQYRVIDFGTGSEADDDSDGTFIKWFLSNVTRYGTVAETLVQIAENEKAVYQSGYDKALEKGKYNEGFEDGRQAEYDAFWDGYQDNGNRVDYAKSFLGRGWTGTTFKPKYNMTVVHGNQMFHTNKYMGSLKELLLKQEVTLTFPNTDNISHLFYGSMFTEIGILDFTTVKQVSHTAIFTGCADLHTIEKIILPQNGFLQFSSWFDSCTALKNITFEGVIGENINFQWSTLLTSVSIESIINHLSDAATGKTLTLSLTAVDNAYGWYLPDGSFIGGSASGHWSSLEASKPNWTINLV